MTKTIAKLHEKTYWCLWGFSIFYCALLVLISYWNVLRDPTILWGVWLLQILPLLVLLPGLYKKHYRSYSWFCFLLLLYFVLAVEGSFKSTATISDYLFVGITSVLFVLSMLASRWLQYALYQQSDKQGD